MATTTTTPPKPPADVLKHVVDVHCHPTDSPISDNVMDELPISICPMATTQDDQELVYELASKFPGKVTPCFGYHPWFAHWISLVDKPPLKEDHYRSLFLIGEADEQREEHEAILQKMLPFLPEPTPLNKLISSMRKHLEAFPTAMVGEIGLDRVVRVPIDRNATPRELSPFTIPFEHQVVIVEAQIELAVEFGRNISFHSVKAQQGTLDLLNRVKAKYGLAWSQISLDVHSCSMSAQTWRDVEKSHSNVFLSLSTAINGRTSAYKKLIKAVSPNRILTESDFHDINECAERTWEMLCLIADLKGWSVEQEWLDDVPQEEWGAVRRLEENWKSFVKGGHVSVEVANEMKKSAKMGRRAGAEMAGEMSE